MSITLPLHACTVPVKRYGAHGGTPPRGHERSFQTATIVRRDGDDREAFLPSFALRLKP